ncbi:MAG: hypothetical protein HYX63_01085 [Gammaproteobacteria bacterium]|nr:hypothetical protein [Gammaproteobacteria bacterium]
MVRTFRISLIALVVFAANVQANDYPTMDRVDQVLTCMRENGGQNVDNMYRCSCEIDAIAQQLSLDDFNAARTYEIYKNMPGEKGGLFRESSDGTAAVKKLENARSDAKKRCFVGAARQTVVPTEKGLPKAAAKAAPAAAQ